MKKFTLSLFTLAVACCLVGCSGSIKQISEHDERASAITDSAYGGIYTFFNAKPSVFTGKYESFDIPEPDITRIIAPIGNDSFVVVKGSEPLLGNPGSEDMLSSCEYGVYTLDKGYCGILLKYFGESEKTVSYIIACGSGYVLYLTGPANAQGVLAVNEYYDLHLLKPDDMTDTVIYRLPGISDIQAAIVNGTVYFDTAVSFERTEKVVMAYNIADGELSTECRYAEHPFVYKGQLAYFIDGKLVSYAAPIFDPAKCGLDANNLKIIPTDDVIAYERTTIDNGASVTVAGYIKDGKPFDIFSAQNNGTTLDIRFLNGCAVWNSFGSELPPVFYSNKHKSLVIVDAEKADYVGFADNGKMSFFEKKDSAYTRAITLNISDVYV